MMVMKFGKSEGCIHKRPDTEQGEGAWGSHIRRL